MQISIITHVETNNIIENKWYLEFQSWWTEGSCLSEGKRLEMQSLFLSVGNGHADSLLSLFLYQMGSQAAALVTCSFSVMHFTLPM